MASAQVGHWSQTSSARARESQREEEKKPRYGQKLIHPEIFEELCDQCTLEEICRAIRRLEIAADQNAAVLTDSNGFNILRAAWNSRREISIERERRILSANVLAENCDEQN